MNLKSSYIFSFNRVNCSYDFVKYDEISLSRYIQHLNTYITRNVFVYQCSAALCDSKFRVNTNFISWINTHNYYFKREIKNISL